MYTIEQFSYQEVFRLWDERKTIRIIGFDTGLANIGWGVIEAGLGKLKLCDVGVINTSPEQELAERLYTIEQEFLNTIDTHNPNLMAYEELFFNNTNMMVVNLPVGVLINTGYKLSLNPKKFRPQDAKYIVTGNGNASKKQVKNAVALHLGMLPAQLNYPDHITDGLAHAVCYYDFLCKVRLNSKK